MSVGAVAGALGAVDSLIEPAKQGIRGALIEYTPVGDAVADLLISVLQLSENIAAEKDQLAVKPTLDSFRAFIKKVFAATAYITAAVSEDAAEVVQEMPSEALSNAIYSGLGGLVDIIMRMKIGGQPPQNFAPDNLDAYTRALLDAMFGVHFHVTMLYNLAQDIDKAENQLHEDPLVQDIFESVRWAKYPNTMTLAQYAELKKTMLFRTLESVASTLEALFQRVQDAILEYKSAEILYNQGQIDSAQFDAVKLKVQAELDAVNQELAAIKEDLQTAMGITETYPAGIDGLLANLNTAYDEMIMNIVNYYIDYWTVLNNTRVNGKPYNYKYIVKVYDPENPAVYVQYEIQGEIYTGETSTSS